MSNTLNPATLLADTSRHRLVLQASLAPVSGDRFQPAGFPEIGHVIYDAPGAYGSTRKVCIVDSAASMANHLESVCFESPLTLALHSDLADLPYVECRTDEGWPVKKKGPHRLVVTSLSEGHRLASSYFVDDRAKLVVNGQPGADTLAAKLLEQFGMPNLGKKTHPLPDDWWNIFKAIFRYDPNSLVHGILFPAWGIKLPRVLTAHHEAFDAGRVGYSGVKFDKLQKTTSGQPIFAKDDEVAREIRATFVLDLALLRSFGRNGIGLTAPQKQFLLDFALWKIGRLLASEFRFRSGCDLHCEKLVQIDDGSAQEIDRKSLSKNIGNSLSAVGLKDTGVTQVYWPADELFKEAKETQATPGAGDEGGTDEEAQ